MKYISVIEISPSFVEMIVCQQGASNYLVVERVREEINIFKGYQKTGKVSFEKSKKLCEILKGMKKISEGYGTYRIQIVTTSSFNQLTNALFLLDQIRIHTGIEVGMPRLLEKKKLLFKKFLKYREELVSQRKTTLLLNIGSSTTDLVFLHNGKLIKNQMISTGGYKVAEFISEEGLSPTETLAFMRDYIYNYLIEIRRELGRKKVVRLSLIGEAGELLLRKYREAPPVRTLARVQLREIIEEVEKLSFKNFASKYGISELLALKGFVELSIVEVIIDEFSIDDMTVLTYDNKELIAYEHFYPEKKQEMEEEMWELSVQAAKALGEKYYFHMGHSEFTLTLSKKLFDTLREVHKIPRRIYRYLEIATYLHDTGKYINFKEHNKHSEYIAKNSFLFGLGEEELEFISFLCYAHSGDGIDYSRYLDRFSSKERIYILKALRILKVAAALDRSKKQKAERIEISLEKEFVIIEVYTRSDFLIEELFFNKQAVFFKEVFGLTPKLQINRRYYGESI